MEELNIAFFGSPDFAVYTLQGLEKNNIVPSLVISQPDKPAGRKLKLTPPPAKVWAEEHAISTFQPNTLRDKDVVQAIIDEGPWDLFIVSAYGKIIPKEILDIPKYGTLNVHPSMLPKLRGASPIQSSILTEDSTGVTIMLMDELMDHGPILKQEVLDIAWPPKASELEKIAAEKGAEMLAQVIPSWIEGDIEAKEQDHDNATECSKITKQDGLLDLQDDAEKNFCKIQAFNIWPRAFFLTQKNGKDIRVVITDAALEHGDLVIKRVIPEGKKEMPYDVFLKS